MEYKIRANWWFLWQGNQESGAVILKFLYQKSEFHYLRQGLLLSEETKYEQVSHKKTHE